ELLDQRPEVDAVLMDLAMPDLDGLQTIRRVRSDPRFRTLPIIGLCGGPSGKVTNGEAETFVEAGANHQLAKPVDAEKLLGLLHLTFARGPRDAS
ncbi:MAG TPA: response regulator, partial [Polyangia bacterium]